MENKFKEGDLVECVEVVGCDLELGNKYEVESVGDFHIGVTKDGKFVGQYKKRRFKLAKQEQEPNYMYVWDVSEKDAIKLDVFADLSTNPRRTNNYPIVALDERGVICAFMHCKTIKQWEADNKPKPLFVNSLGEEFFEGDIVWMFSFKDYKIYHCNIGNIYIETYTAIEDVRSEIMTKESAEKYIKEHAAKYRPFTMEEFIEVNNNWIISKIIKEGLYVVSCNSKDVYVHDGTISYEALLRDYTFKNGTPCGVILK